MIGVCQLSFSRLNPASTKRVLRRDWCHFPASHIRLYVDIDWLKPKSASLYKARTLQCVNREWMEIHIHLTVHAEPSGLGYFHKGMKPRSIFLNYLLLTDPQSQSLSSQMT